MFYLILIIVCIINFFLLGNYLYFYIGVGLFFIFSLLISGEEQEIKDTNKKDKKNDDEPLPRYDRYKGMDDTVFNIKNYEDAKKEAIRVLHQFGIRNITYKYGDDEQKINLSLENYDIIPDEDLVMEFSRLADIKTEFETSWQIPKGIAGERQTRVDGIICLLAYANDFAKYVITHSDFVEIWKRERYKKIEMSKFIQNVHADELWNKILNRKKEWIVQFDGLDDEKRYIDFDRFYKIYVEEYENIIRDKFGLSLENPFTFFEKLHIEAGYSTDIHMLSQMEVLKYYSTVKILFPIKKKEQGN